MITRNLTSKTQESNQIQFGSVFTKTSSMVSKLNSVTRLSEVNNQPDENNGNLNIGKPGFDNHTWDSILKVTESRKPKHSNRYSIHRKSFKTRSSVQNQGSSKNSLQVSSNCNFSLNSTNSSAAESRGITSSVGIRTSLPTPVKLTRTSKPLSSPALLRAGRSSSSDW